MSTQFDLEQDIMSAWATADDIKLVLHSFDSLSEDQRMNALIGIEQMHTLRMNKLFATFETFLKEYYRAVKGAKSDPDTKDIANES